MICIHRGENGQERGVRQKAIKKKKRKEKQRERGTIRLIKRDKTA